MAVPDLEQRILGHHLIQWAVGLECPFVWEGKEADPRRRGTRVTAPDHRSIGLGFPIPIRSQFWMHEH